MPTERTDMLPRILSVSPNPAWQKTLHFEALVPGEVNRADRIWESGGGKGNNLARTLRLLGSDVVVAQFAGGYTGDLLCSELDRTRTRHLTVRTSSTTRVCTTVMSDVEPRVTELIEPSGPVSGSEAGALLKMIFDALPHCDGVALCGTCPPGVSADFYAGIAEAARPRAVVLLDAVRDVKRTLWAGVDILKINVDEIRRLSECQDVSAAVDYCFEHFSTSVIALTDGSSKAYLFTPERAWRFAIPQVSVRNTIGAGDCASAVMLNGVVRARMGGGGESLAVSDLPAESLQYAFRWALACASASCLRDIPSEFSSADAEQLCDEIQVDDFR